MDAPRRSPHQLLAALVLVVLLGPARARAADALPLAVRDERCTFVLTTADADDQFDLVLGSLARHGGPFRVRVQTEAAAAATSTGTATGASRCCSPAGSASCKAAGWCWAASSAAATSTATWGRRSATAATCCT